MHFTSRSRSTSHAASEHQHPTSEGADDSDLVFGEEEDAELFAPEEDSSNELVGQTWKILVVDDEPLVREVTQLALQDFSFEGRSLEFLHAGSGAEAKQVLEAHSDIAAIFLDVVMETQWAGLDLVRYIRGPLNNQLVRIIIRTGQPGQVLEDRVAYDYDINDYKTKAELTRQKLRTATIASLRNFSLLLRIQQSQEKLERIARENAELYRQVNEYAYTLERKVRERTQEIAEKNRQLEREVQERRQVEAALQHVNQELQRLVSIDGLTQVANRRHFDEYLQQEWQRALAQQNPISLILSDVDYFKLYNDAYGHQAGDECLQRIARALQDAVAQPSDLVARYGGEEFAIILAQTSAAQAQQAAQMMQEAVQNLQIPHCQSQISPYITLSLGVSTQVPAVGQSVTELIATADAALYQAKRQGRNCICCHPG